MKLVNRVLVDLKGKPIIAPDNAPLTAALVLLNAALSPPANPQQPRPAKDIAARYELAIMLNGVAAEAEFEVPVELITALRDDMIRGYPTVVSGQMLPVLEGKPHWSAAMYGVRPYATGVYGDGAPGAGAAVIRDPLCTDGLITLYQLDLARLGGPIFYFASAEDFSTEIVWGGQLYTALPMQAEGFEYTTRGAIPQPTVTFSNLFGGGNLLLDSYKGLVGADLVRILTLRRFLDDGSTPDPTAYITRDVFVVAQKTSHNVVAIAFKLAARIDQQGTLLPRRTIMRDVCSHVYRFWDESIGAFNYAFATCPYTGDAAFDTNDAPTDWQHDACSRRITGCKARFGSGPLPGRFFPGVGRVQ